MAKRYPVAAIEKARELYLHHGGLNHDAIEAGMRKAGYVGWKKALLYDKGKPGTPNVRFGWVTKHGFERSLEIRTLALVTQVNDDEQDLYLGIKTKRKQMQAQCAGMDATKELLWLYRDFCKLEIEARKNLDLSRDNLETFVAGYEKLMQWLGTIDPSGKAVKELVKHSERLIETAQAYYGKSEENSDGAGPGEDEGGEQPGSDKLRVG